ncbi:FkbM family methyltransferase [Pectinatus brassicae]|uniref:FkbM family methyltransferase n=1 Tax=Pectinatus brassicae TaxID=862415 RepID=A0A840UMW5_9FIRM|nr:FkbM family methyltransferase [Pectinatus brassicae]MBB5337550.1 FkbM family methyltransferase [Pectinatus brassicae]
MGKFINFVKTIYTDNYDIKLRYAIMSGREIVLFDFSADFNNVVATMNLLQEHNIIIKRIIFPDELFEHVVKKIYIGDKLGIICNKLSEVKNIYGERYPVVLFNQTGIIDNIWYNYFRKVFGEDYNMIFALNNIMSVKPCLDRFFQNLDKIYQVYSLFDEKSKEIYLSVLKSYISLDITDRIFDEGAQYFLDGYTVTDNDIVIDAGAFDGRTAWDFFSAMRKSGKVYSFEMNEDNLKKIDDFLGNAEKNIVIENMGLGKIDEEVSYLPRGAATTYRNSTNDHDTKKAVITTLDSYSANNKLEKIDFIKMDIEGAELDALKGAKDSIQKWKPKMAICLYHIFEDLWEIPLYIKELNSQYKFAFRQYACYGKTNDDWPMLYRQLNDIYGEKGIIYSMGEFVLYCR